MKSVKITGTNNRYQMKKVTRENEIYKYKTRTSVEEWDPSLYTEETQMELLREIKEELDISPTNDAVILHKKNQKLMKREIEQKLHGYKSQDKIKKREGINITFLQSVDKMIETRLMCYYCNIKCHIFYERVREMSQWSFDRIDNSMCHGVDNVVISCLKCNLERKTRSSKKFKDSKEMKDVILLETIKEETNAEENGTEISDPEPHPEKEPLVSSTRMSTRLIEKLANNVMVDDSVIVSV